MEPEGRGTWPAEALIASSVVVLPALSIPRISSRCENRKIQFVNCGRHVGECISLIDTMSGLWKSHLSNCERRENIH